MQYPISAIRGQSLPEFAEAIGNHGRILKKRAGTYEDQHIDMVIIFMSSSTKATIHLGQNFIENMTVCKNIDVEEIQDLFSITQRLVWDHSEEIQNVKVTESTDCSWTRTKLSHRQVIKRTKGKSPCILRLCTMSGKLSSEATQRWKGQLTDFESTASYLTDFESTASYQELLGVDGEPIEFECNTLRERSSLQILLKNQNDLRERNLNLKKLEIGLSSCLCSTTLDKKMQ